MQNLIPCRFHIEVEAVLKSEGLRATKQRLEIWDELCSTDSHRDIETILADLKKKKINVSRATLYSVALETLIFFFFRSAKMVSISRWLSVEQSSSHISNRCLVALKPSLFRTASTSIWNLHGIKFCIYQITLN